MSDNYTHSGGEGPRDLLNLYVTPITNIPLQTYSHYKHTDCWPCCMGKKVSVKVVQQTLGIAHILTSEH